MTIAACDLRVALEGQSRGSVLVEINAIHYFWLKPHMINYSIVTVKEHYECFWTASVQVQLIHTVISSLDL